MLVVHSETCDRLARELAELTGEPIDVAVTRALEERVARQRRDKPDGAALTEAEKQARLDELFARLRAPGPVLDPRPVDDILGYDEDGVWR